MPTYQYRCLDCTRRFEVFLTYVEYESAVVECPHCGSQHIQRRIGRIRVARSEESRMDELVDSTDIDGLENNPQAMGKMLKNLSREMGEDLGPEFGEVIGRLESGESPEQIEKTMPDLGGASDGGVGLGGEDF